MSTQLKPFDVEAAVVACLEKDLKAAGVRVRAATEQDFDADGNLIVVPPIVLVIWSGAQFDGDQDNQQTIYDASQPITLICGARSLRGSAEERTGAQQIVAAVLNSMAGARFTLADKSVTPPVKLNGVSLLTFGSTGTWYSVSVVVEALTQFDGANG